MSFRKNREGRMGILTIPQGTRMYKRSTQGATFERAKKDFDVLALPSHGSRTHFGAGAYSFKLYDEFWYVLLEDLPQTETDIDSPNSSDYTTETRHDET